MTWFKSLVDKMNKQKEFKNWIDEELTQEIELIPWVDKPQLQDTISVRWTVSQAQIDDLQTQIDSLDARVTALWG